jgi:hypothetical protein
MRPNTKLSSWFEYRVLMIVSKYFAGGGLWRLLNINLFITSTRPLISIFSLFWLYIWDHYVYIHNLCTFYDSFQVMTILHQQNILIQSLTLYTQINCSIWCWWTTVEVYKIAKMYIEYVVYCPFEIYSVSAETIINDAFSYSENV